MRLLFLLIWVGILLTCSPIAATEPLNPSNATSYAPGQLLVQFDSSPAGGTQGISALASSLNAPIGATMVRDYGILGLPGLSLVRLDSNMAVAKAVAYYSSSPGVVYAEPDWYVSAADLPDDPDLFRQWGLSNTGQVFRENTTPGTPGADIHASSAWNRSTGSRSSQVAVVDTGIDIDHPDLHANIRVGLDTGLHGLNVIGGEEYEPWDDDGHGTHCAGIIGMVGNNGIGGSGVNWNITIVPIKVLDAERQGTTSDILLGILYASAIQIPVISCSLGGPYSHAMHDALAGSSSLIVASAGNEQIDTDIVPVYPACYNLSNIIAVAATDSHDNLSWFSNYGNHSIHIGAPGEDIYSTYPSLYSYAPVWHASAGDLSSWNITGNYTVNTTTGYPAPPSLSLSRIAWDFSEVVGETKDMVRTSNLTTEDEFYCYYRVYSESSESGGVIDIFTGYDKEGWNHEGRISCGETGVWKYGFIPVRNGIGDEAYVKVSIRASSFSDPVTLTIGDIGIGRRSSVIQPGYEYMDGTSMAAPFVAGGASLIHQADPSLSAPEIRDIIMETADPVPALSGKTITGGRLNLSAALERAGQTDAITLLPGWNFISVPASPVPGYETLSVFAGVDSDGHSVLTYHNDTTGWRPAGRDDPLKRLEGYWIFSKDRTRIQMEYLPVSPAVSRNISPGWNAVGGWKKEDLCANLTFSSLGDTWSYLYGFDAGKQQYDEVIIRGGAGNMSDSRPVLPSRGYWLYATGNGTYTGVGQIPS